MRLVTRFLADERGVTAIEYGLIASAIALAISVTLLSVGSGLNNAFGRIGNALR